MGLSIQVGYLADMLTNDEEGAQWFREDLSRLNSYLQSLGMPEHVEPEDCPTFSADMWGYSGLHYLRRSAAHIDLRGSLPEPGESDAGRDGVLQAYYNALNNPAPSLLSRILGKRPTTRTYDHLISHSDSEGFYVPQDFKDVLIPPETFEIPGDMVGSSVRLLDEMQRLARALELPLDMDAESDELAQAAESQGDGDLQWQRYGVESFTCLHLYKAAQASIENSSLIVFC
jgi:hypothetical protein